MRAAVEILVQMIGAVFIVVGAGALLFAMYPVAQAVINRGTPTDAITMSVLYNQGTYYAIVAVAALILGFGLWNAAVPESKA